MSDYIRKEDVLKGQKTGTFANGICFVAEPCVTVKYIESLEPADVVQVVRCGKCRYCTDNWHSSVYDLCKISGRNVIDTDFCNYGKRREE